MAAGEGGIVAFTIAVAALAVLLILPPGIALAWLLARRRFPGKAVVETLVALPLVMPPVATGLILLKLLGRRGVIGRFLQERLDLDIIFTWRAVVVAMAVMSFPLLVRTARVAFEKVDPLLEKSARTLGAGRLRVFFRITLPLASGGVAGGTLLAFARALGEFGATILVAGNIPGRTTTLSLAIYNLVQLGKDDEAYRLLAWSVAIAFVAVWCGEAFLRRKLDGDRH
ncbi:MAG TPA: molybdate ABC transporter permease subunit [Thermoanaerobaculia bacterium]|nr:molybdate ABC transporter permease subunit [Thermoanaerobaculia bacterium]